MNPVAASLITLALVVYASARKSLTLPGIAAAVVTAAAHAIHPWSVFFVLLITFFIAGTTVTKVNHVYKSTLTSSASGGGGPAAAAHPRTHIQVFANSLPASVLILLHTLYLDTQLHAMPTFLSTGGQTAICLPHPRPTRAIAAPNFLNAAPYGIIAMYAAMAADTFASELGILSRERPRLITNPFRTAPRGTNGAVTLSGVLASALGAFIVAATAALFIPFCDSRTPQLENARTAYVHGYTLEGIGGQRHWLGQEKLTLIVLVTGWGVVGGLLDSLFGVLLQASVVDVRSGKVIEGDGGRRVIHAAGKSKGDDGKGGRKVLVGRDILDNNGVNLLMAASIAVAATASTAMYMGASPAKLVSDVLQFWPTLRQRGWF